MIYYFDNTIRIRIHCYRIITVSIIYRIASFVVGRVVYCEVVISVVVVTTLVCFHWGNTYKQRTTPAKRNKFTWNKPNRYGKSAKEYALVLCSEKLLFSILRGRFSIVSCPIKFLLFNMLMTGFKFKTISNVRYPLKYCFYDCLL